MENDFDAHCVDCNFLLTPVCDAFDASDAVDAVYI